MSMAACETEIWKNSFQVASCNTEEYARKLQEAQEGKQNIEDQLVAVTAELVDLKVAMQDFFAPPKGIHTTTGRHNNRGIY